jgi:hypothetical protein
MSNPRLRPAPQFTIVIPARNESDNVEPILRWLDAVLTGVSTEIVFVDDRDDGTADAIRAAAAAAIAMAVLGLAGALLVGRLFGPGSFRTATNTGALDVALAATIAISRVGGHGPSLRHERTNATTCPEGASPGRHWRSSRPASATPGCLQSPHRSSTPSSAAAARVEWPRR